MSTFYEEFTELNTALDELVLAICKELKIEVIVEWLNNILIKWGE